MAINFRNSYISVIVPVYNGAATLPACLAALQRACYDGTEVLVIDDRSTDNSAAIAEQSGARVFRNTHAKGPAGARNQGAEHAGGEILLFVDADVVVQENTISRVEDLFRSDPDLSAIFGSYDAEPEQRNFLSQYKNLFHHYVHQTALEETSSFWAGCGAIRAEVFHKLGGFDEAAYPHASIEDIELGSRLFRNGYRTRLVKSLRVKHLKKWTVRGLLRADILYRAVPWTQLIAGSGSIPNDLNLHTSQRISALVAWILVATPLLLMLPPISGQAVLAIAAICLAAIILLNRDFYRFFLRHRGLWFTLGVLVWHLFYFLYSSAVFGACWAYYRIFAMKRRTD